ncbi:dephospho-CoA kinase [Compostibacter hankyongensis]|uniref:Dephospho-CoA kinase n=1 Tax=Compostibacter hankyongensis TaxID=1007089 RepID=A0ABP8FPX9_9BACT
MKVGITGGIGSGKSTVCRIFAVLGVPVYDADGAARRLMNEDEALKAEITRAFGSRAYDASGRLDRSWLGHTVFADPEKLARLDALVHPVTLRDSAAWAERQTAPYVIKEAALMFETSAFHQMDHIIGVYAPVSLRIRRTMQRSGISREEVLQRMSRQLDETLKMRLCDQVITNDGQQALIPQVLALHRWLLAGAGSPA